MGGDHFYDRNSQSASGCCKRADLTGVSSQLAWCSAESARIQATPRIPHVLLRATAGFFEHKMVGRSSSQSCQAVPNSGVAKFTH